MGFRCPISTTVILAAGYLVLTGQAAAQVEMPLDEQVRIVEENGIRFRETRTTVRRPVAEVRIDERPLVLQTPEYVNRLRQVPQIVHVPVQRQQIVTQHAWWNPWRWGRPVNWVEPVTVWQPQLRYGWVANTTTSWVPTTKKVQIARRYLRFETEELVSRVALAPGSEGTQIAAQADGATMNPERRIETASRVGGLHRFDSDPPKQPTLPTILTPTLVR